MNKFKSDKKKLKLTTEEEVSDYSVGRTSGDQLARLSLPPSLRRDIASEEVSFALSVKLRGPEGMHSALIQERGPQGLLAVRLFVTSLNIRNPPPSPKNKLEMPREMYTTIKLLEVIEKMNILGKLDGEKYRDNVKKSLEKYDKLKKIMKNFDLDRFVEVPITPTIRKQL